MNNRKLIFNLVVILNANALAMAATGTWHSIATGSNLTYTASSATGIAAQDVNGKAMTIVYLENLGFQKIGQNSNVDDVAWQYLLRGYVVNQRLEQLERRVAATEEKIDFFVHKSLPPVEGVFYDGQIFDAYAQIYREVLH